MKRTLTALVLGMLLMVPVLAQEQPKATTNTTAQVVSPAPVPAPTPTAPVKDPKHWKKPLKDIKFREF